MHLAKFIFSLAVTLCLFVGSNAQNRIYLPLNTALDNPRTVGIEIIAGQKEIIDFIARKEEFVNLNRVRILRYRNDESTSLLMASLSTFNTIRQLEFTLPNFEVVPAQIDRFGELNRIIVTSTQFQNRVGEPFRFIAINSEGDYMTIDVHADKDNAIAFMDRFFSQYPNLVKPINSFNVYAPRTDLRKVEGTNYGFQPLLLPQTDCFKINPAEESKIIASDGSIYSVPANAFVDKNGNAITDSVQIDITKITDPVDIAFSRIPMHTTDDQWLESAGMFEINASKDQEFLKLATGESIAVEFYSTAPGSYNIYEMDADRNAWAITDSNNRDYNSSSVFTPAFLEYNRFYTSLSLIDNFDEASKSTDHFESSDYIRFEHRNDTEWASFDISETEGCEDLRRKYKSQVRRPHRGSKPLLELKREKDQSKALSKHYFFSFHQSDRAMSSLRGLSRIYWYTKEPMNGTAFRNEYRKDKVYIDFRLHYIQETESFKFILKDICGVFDTLIAKPYPKNSRDSDKDDLFHLQILDQYNEDWKREKEKLNRTEERDRRKFNTKLNKRIKNYEKEELEFWQSIQESMTPTERELTFDGWQTYFLSTLEVYQNTMMRASNYGQTFLRQFNITGLGYWNCDRPILRNGSFQDVKILADKLKENNKEAITVTAIFQRYNTTLNTGAETKYNRSGSNAYLIFNGEYVSWIEPSEAKFLKQKTLTLKRPFIPVDELNYDAMKADLLSWTN